MSNVSMSKDRIRSVQETAERFHVLAEVCGVGVVITERGNILETNTLFANMTGYTMKELKGMHAAELVRSDSRDRLLWHIEQEDEHPFRVTMVRKDGTQFLAEAEGRQIHHDGKVARLAVIRELNS